jgi:6-pyruvoyltetrahydropterin/6-carboxytetrahydropterin synthase
MYDVTIKRSFSAAHTLKNIGGQCETLHGHNFIVEVTLSGQKLNEEGVLIDFRILKQWTDQVLESLDHQYLNDLPYFKDINPSSEQIAQYIYDWINGRKEMPDLVVASVTVWESENAKATYRGGMQEQ